MRYDGTIVGGGLSTEVSGSLENALMLDGDDDFMDVGTVTEWVEPTAFSVSLWFRRMVDHAGNDNATDNKVNNVLIAQSSGNFFNSFTNLEIGSEGDTIEIYLKTQKSGGQADLLRVPAMIQNDTWHHLVVTYDEQDSRELKVYVDVTIVDTNGDYDSPLNWTSSKTFDGTPGFDPDLPVHQVLINEVLANSQASRQDVIELVNLGDQTVNLSH